MPSPASDKAPGSVDGPPRTWSLELPAVPESLDPVQDLVAEMYDSVEDDLHAMDRIRFETAVVEIVGNVIEHAVAERDGTGVRMEVSVARDGRELRGVITDDGAARRGRPDRHPHDRTGRRRRAGSGHGPGPGLGPALRAGRRPQPVDGDMPLRLRRPRHPRAARG